MITPALPRNLNHAGTSVRASEPAAAIEKLIRDIAELPSDWHAAGTMGETVLHAIARHACERDIKSSVETGSGKSTLLFSHLSQHHKVFAKENENRSITVARESSLLNRSTVEFIEGPTQATLPQHQFDDKLQLVLLDGPHGYPFPELEYYFLYPHLETNGLLIVDDIQIPTIYRMFEVLREDQMFHLVEVVENTAFFVRTDAPVFSPVGDGWWLQGFNKKRFPVGAKTSLEQKLRGSIGPWVPAPLKKSLSRLTGSRK
jgi:methyltransferase family protein